MATKTRSIVFAAAAILCLGMIAVAWGTFRVVTWASDLPNRISIQIDDQSASQTAAWMVTESIRAALSDPDPEQQLACLQTMADGVETNPEAIPWIQSEFTDELAALTASPDPDVATLAQRLSSPPPSNPPPQ